MDMMAIRRRVLMGGKKVIDTSPKILAYGYRYPGSNSAIIVDSERCITDKYQYPLSSDVQTMVSCGVTSFIRLFDVNGDYMDYWSWTPSDGYERKAINANSAYIACTLVIEDIDISYAYLKETGQIFFAGKNSPYYGYTNINDMPT